MQESTEFPVHRDGNEGDAEKDLSTNKKHYDCNFAEVLHGVSNIHDEMEAQKYLCNEIRVGKITESDISVLMQKWRQKKRRKFNEGSEEKINKMEGTLEDVKRKVSDLVRNKKLKKADAGNIVKKWRNAERRRVNRQLIKKAKRACFNCRQPGHVLADCPNRDDNEQTVGNTSLENSSGICFKCGSSEHCARSCMRKHVKGFPFATCFICGHQGHLSRDCERNANGIYPNGGCCNLCGSSKHLKRDCPELVASKQEKDERIGIQTISDMSSADMDDALEGRITKKNVEKKPKRKIVVF